MDKNKVKLTIGGVNYIVITDNEPQYAEFLASEIDSRLGEITARSNTQILSTKRRRSAKNSESV